MFKFSFLFFLIFVASTCKSDSFLLPEKSNTCDLNDLFTGDYRMKEMDFLGKFSKLLDNSNFDETKGIYVRAIFIFDLEKNSTTGSRLKLTRLIIYDLRNSFNDKEQIEEQFYSKMEESTEELWEIINHNKLDEDCTGYIYVETFRLCG